MSNNSSKQIILSVVSVAILIIAVVGVSFAVFSYTRKGTSNNKITTGKIVFSFNDGDTINLTNHFPISTETGVGLTGENNVCTFTITGNSVGGNITYHVYAVPGETETGKTRFQDNEVFAYITSTLGSNATSENFSFTPAGSFGQGAALTGIASTNGVELGSGLIKTTSAATAATSRTRNFEVHMWVDSSVVSISDTQTGNHIYSTTDYENLYYSMKIQVVANA